MPLYVVRLEQLDDAQLALVGGKAANLAALSRVPEFRVPAGICVTTDAFRRIMAEARSTGDLLERLSRLEPDDHAAVATLSADIRRMIEAVAIPDDLATDITQAIGELGATFAYAVRSSATAEDLPTASFAGQHDSYLNISGTAAILEHVSRCWASLFTERAVTYRLQNSVDHRTARMAVIVQKMIVPQAAGILFTADPVTGNRKVVSIEATRGLAEALVSGLVNADVYKVRGSEIVAQTVRQDQPVLGERRIVRLAQLGRQIEAHFGRPQDIEWCIADDEIQIVQSRPITTLFPIPHAADSANHVYLSVGHQQMMTDAMKPLGISTWQLMAAAPMHEAGGRLFVDVTRALSTAAGRAGLLGLAGKSDPLTGDALRTLIERDFIPLAPDAEAAPPMVGSVPSSIETDASIVDELIAEGQASIRKLERDIEAKSGTELFDFILADVQELKGLAFKARSLQAVMAGIEATWWLNDRLEEWLGEKDAAHTLAQSVPNNVTSQMGLNLMHVADVIRPYPAVIEYLQRASNEDFLNDLSRLTGGEEARDAIRTWLDKYGMRGAGEIDITRPRWRERPTTLLPVILGNVRNFTPRTGEQRFEQGREAARKAEHELLARLRSLPDGERKADEAKRMIDRLRTFMGYREYPKYLLINRISAYRRALLKEAGRLVDAGVLADEEDTFFLTFHELRDAVRTHEVDHRLIRERKDAFRANERLTPPRVLTSDGEMVAGAYRRDDLPSDALAGLGVSPGIVEGRARVVFDPAKAHLEPGDILVTQFTDPSWTPLFVAVRGLVTEVGGLMTHGAVIAREYGLPAVVGVEHATRLIRDGQRIRIHGAEGYVELLA